MKVSRSISDLPECPHYSLGSYHIIETIHDAWLKADLGEFKLAYHDLDVKDNKITVYLSTAESSAKKYISYLKVPQLSIDPRTGVGTWKIITHCSSMDKDKVRYGDLEKNWIRRNKYWSTS